MFDKDRFIENCKDAVSEGPLMIRELVAEAVSDRPGMTAAFGEPAHAGITSLYSSPELTIIHFVWAPCMSLMPHNHQMFSVVGIYSGREDNVFWRRTANSIEAEGAKSLAAGEVTVLEWDVIHSVLNPIEKMTSAIHVYGGDFFHPREARSEWDHETLIERPWDVEHAKTLFRQAERRFQSVAK